MILQAKTSTANRMYPVGSSVTDITTTTSDELEIYDGSDETLITFTGATGFIENAANNRFGIYPADLETGVSTTQVWTTTVVDTVYSLVWGEGSFTGALAQLQSYYQGNRIIRIVATDASSRIASYEFEKTSDAIIQDFGGDDGFVIEGRLVSQTIAAGFTPANSGTSAVISAIQPLINPKTLITDYSLSTNAGAALTSPILKLGTMNTKGKITEHLTS